MLPRPILLSLALLFGTILAGLAIRFAHFGLPPFVVKYGGSALWALTIYWLVSALLPRARIPAATALAAALATAVECFKLYNPPSVDAFRRTLPGILLLGRYFSVWDLLAYAVAIAAGALLDARLRPLFNRS
jgi:hypothetical protein